MRIISGKFKGRVISAPKNLPTRPTTDYAKEGLFNVLQHQFEIENSTVLDLFCGTGNISFEFLSREAREVISVDINQNCVKFVIDVSKKLNLSNHKVIRDDSLNFIKKAKTKFDIIFADPPYALKNIDPIPKLIFDNHLLNTNGLLIVEHGKDTDLSQIANFDSHRKYGNVNFSFFLNKPNE